MFVCMFLDGQDSNYKEFGVMVALNDANFTLSFSGGFTVSHVTVRNTYTHTIKRDFPESLPFPKYRDNP
jgi:hypothetical protein